jgi:pyruvate/2-oxoglutarate dehydrogenase complex dihydrolipoamide dehydrogenase (E3) component
MSTPEFDFAILGAGAAGLIAADFAVQLGACTALLDKGPIGGDCTWTGCVPSKSLIKVATVAHHARVVAKYGVATSQPITDMAKVRDYLRATIQQIYTPTMPESLEKKGMNVFIGPARFIDPHTVETGTRKIRAKKFLICTGAEPSGPSIAGLSEVPYFTYQKIFENDRLPEHLLVIGGGPIGCDIAEAYRRLGSRMTVIAELYFRTRNRKRRNSWAGSSSRKALNASLLGRNLFAAKRVPSPFTLRSGMQRALCFSLQPVALRSFGALG